MPPFIFMTWYRRLKPPRPKAARIRYSLSRPSSGLHLKKPPKKRKPKYVFYRTYSKPLHVNGYKIKVISKYGISKYFDVPLITITRWEDAGALPEPFIEQTRGGKVVKFYLAAQIYCLAKVVNDLIDDGYIAIRWRTLPDHVEMLHAGYASAFASLNRRMTSTGGYRSHDKYGVEIGG
jgi:hypothetical protein